RPGDGVDLPPDPRAARPHPPAVPGDARAVAGRPGRRDHHGHRAELPPPARPGHPVAAAQPAGAAGAAGTPAGRGRRARRRAAPHRGRPRAARTGGGGACPGGRRERAEPGRAGAGAGRREPGGRGVARRRCLSLVRGRYGVAMTDVTPASFAPGLTTDDLGGTVPDPRSAPAVRWGVLGAGNIAGSFSDGVRQHTAASVVAVGSRDLARAEAFAAAHAPGARSHGDYEALVTDPEVDVVYVA